jgi:hypothetical protein
MKTTGLIIASFVLMSISLSAQTTLKIKGDTLNLRNGFTDQAFKDTIKLGNLFRSGGQPMPIPNGSLSRLNQSLAQSSNRLSEMPVFYPNYGQEMPVMKPDSSVHYYLLIKKIRK